MIVILADAKETALKSFTTELYERRIHTKHR